MTAPNESYLTIPLSQGQFAIVDLVDYATQSQWKWHAWWNQFTRSFYAVRHATLPDGTATKVWMHREILGLKFKGAERGDHINHDTLDNRRSNLRIVTHSQNQQNRRPTRSKKYGTLKGSSYSVKKNKWRAQICVNSLTMNGSWRLTEEDAHADYCKMAREHFGEFAKLE